MATNTTNYNLEKPSEDDFYDVEVQNSNMDIIDNALNTLSETASDTSTATETKTIVEDIQTTIGETEDTGATATTGTLMGKINAIFTNSAVIQTVQLYVTALVETMGAKANETSVQSVKTIVEGISSDVGNTALETSVQAVKTVVDGVASSVDGVALETSVNSIINKIGDSTDTDSVLGLLGRGVVKSVQRGTVSLSSDTTKTITINEITPEKATCQYLSFNVSGSNSSTGRGYITGLTNTELTITNSSSTTSASTGHWEVVEFY